jgi:Glyoxalase-like domain
MHDRKTARHSDRLPGPVGAGRILAFARAADFAAPTWPAPEVQQQMHIDVMVPDLDEAERAAVALGARRLPGGADIFRVFADPAGHPFCLCLEP